MFGVPAPSATDGVRNACTPAPFDGARSMYMVAVCVPLPVSLAGFLAGHALDREREEGR